MDKTDIRWKQRFQHYKDALRSIEDVAPGYGAMSDLEKDGLIQRFEFTFDLSWKVMQDYLLFCGYGGIKGPRACIAQMANDNQLDAFVWEDILKARNELSHIYNEDKSRLYLDNIVYDFLPAFLSFKQQMEQK